MLIKTDVNWEQAYYSKVFACDVNIKGDIFTCSILNDVNVPKKAVV